MAVPLKPIRRHQPSKMCFVFDQRIRKLARRNVFGSWCFGFGEAKIRLIRKLGVLRNRCEERQQRRKDKWKG